MIKLIAGEKGSGKTKKLMAAANNEITTAKGNHVYITRNLMHSMDIDRRLRFINIEDYAIKNSADRFIAFLEGLIAGNSDITKIYIDGMSRFLKPVSELEEFFEELNEISKKHNVTFTVTASCAVAPEYFSRYTVV